MAAVTKAPKRGDTKKEKPVIKIIDWSYSRWSDYERCPYYAKAKHIDKIPEPGNAAMSRGLEIHRLADEFLKGSLARVPKVLASVADRLKGLKKAKALSELKMAVNRQWKQTPFFGETGVCRIVTDALSVKSKSAELVDWKSGKSQNTPIEVGERQLSLQAIGVLSIYPLVEEVKASLNYVDEAGHEQSVIFNRKQIPALTKQWDKDTRAMLNDTEFKPRVNSKCRFCPYSKSKGGTCKY